jgi:hypothetical protein
MTSPMHVAPSPFRPYHSEVNLIWLEGLFKSQPKLKRPPSQLQFYYITPNNEAVLCLTAQGTSGMIYMGMCRHKKNMVWR